MLEQLTEVPIELQISANSQTSTTQDQRKQLPADQLARRVVDIATDKQASDIVLLDIRPVSYLADYFVVCSGQSERQVKAIKDALVEALAKEGVKPVHSDGTTGSGWIVLDYGDVVVHVFSPDTRSYYHIEKVWSEAGLVLRVQ